MTNDTHQTSLILQTTKTEDRLPGWPEIATGLGAAAAMVLALALLAPILPSEPVAYGLTLAAWSAAVAFVGFGAAFAARLRSLAVFGVRRTTWRWMIIGVGAGIMAFLLKGVVNAVLIVFTGFDEDAQVPFQEAGNGGVLALVMTFVVLSFLVPFGEELLFRGVLMRGLLRYGAVIAVLGSSIVFALFHGFNLALPTALVVGIIAAEVARRSGSIWPAVVVHVVNNLALPLFVMFLGLGSAT